jgi:uncharacterized membrane protein
MTWAEESRTAYRRIGGQVHSIQEIRDEAGRLIDTVTKPLKVEFRLQDVGQLLAGAFMMGIPMALAEEVWVLGETLPTGRILLIALLSILVLALFIWGLFYGGHIAEFKFDFFKRVTVSYLITFGVSLLLLALFGKAGFNLSLAIRRAVIVAFPAVFAASSVDFIR